MPESQRRTLRLLTAGLVFATAVTFSPLWAPIVLAAWTADLLRPASRKLERLLRGRRRGAAGIVVLFVAIALVPLAGVATATAWGARDLLERLRSAVEDRQSVTTVLFGGDGASSPTFRDWAELASRHGANAWRAFAVVMRASASVLVAAVVFIVTLYALLASGSRTYRWFVRNAPLPRNTVHRFARAFRETGRALFVGGGGTAAIQGLTATAAYALIGIPHAFVLGPLTGLCSIVPVVGTGIIWVPIAAELVATGDYVRAVELVVAGAGVIGVIDNLVRPVLTRHAHLNLPTAVVVISMLGGIAAFGATGALLGPLLARLTVEALALAREEEWFSRASSEGTPREGEPERSHPGAVLTNDVSARERSWA